MIEGDLVLVIAAVASMPFAFADVRADVALRRRWRRA